MVNYSVQQSTDTDFILTLLEGEYKGTTVKVVDLKYSEDGTFDFEIELPKNKTELFEDEDFKEEVSEIVGDIVKKSVDAVWKSQEELTDIETNVGNILKENHVEYNEDKLLIEQFMEKGFLLKKETLEDETIEYVAIDIKENKMYHLKDETEFNEVRKKVFTKFLLN